ncbi:unnamed protein product, partial [Iphiclides podalirius]
MYSGTGAMLLRGRLYALWYSGDLNAEAPLSEAATVKPITIAQRPMVQSAGKGFVEPQRRRLGEGDAKLARDMTSNHKKSLRIGACGAGPNFAGDRKTPIYHVCLDGCDNDGHFKIKLKLRP